MVKRKKDKNGGYFRRDTIRCHKALLETGILEIAEVIRERNICLATKIVRRYDWRHLCICICSLSAPYGCLMLTPYKENPLLFGGLFE